MLANPEADATNIATTFFKLGNVWCEAFDAASLKLFLEFWRFVRHNGVFAGADHITGKTLGAFVVIDDDFVEVFDVFEFLARFVIESFRAVGDCVLVDDCESKIEVIPEAVGMVCERIDVVSAVVV